MTIAIDVLLSLILLCAGYVYTCYYFNDVKGIVFNKNALRLTPRKVFYLIFGLVIVSALVVLFETIYSLTALSQVKLLSLVLIMLPIAAVDLREQKIPNKLLLAALAIRLLIYVAEFVTSVPMALTTLKDNVLGAIIIGVFLWGAINSVFFSLMVSFVLSVGLLITKKKGRKDTISFGPCILLGTVIAIALAGM